MMKKLSIDSRVGIYGSSKKDIETAETLITASLPELPQLDEPKARLALQDLIDNKKLKASILFDGNSVWSFSRIIKDVRAVKKNGMKNMTKYLYSFLINNCGSIAHYSLDGWIEVYPTVEHLRSFFRKNEFGQRVKQHIPQRFTIVIIIFWRLGKINLSKLSDKLLRRTFLLLSL